MGCEKSRGDTADGGEFDAIVREVPTIPRGQFRVSAAVAGIVGGPNPLASAIHQLVGIERIHLTDPAQLLMPSPKPGSVRSVGRISRRIIWAIPEILLL